MSSVISPHGFLLPISPLAWAVPGQLGHGPRAVTTYCPDLLKIFVQLYLYVVWTVLQLFQYFDQLKKKLV